MKKVFKKVVATVAALAFAVAGLVVAPKTAKAAGTTVKVYVELPSLNEKLSAKSKGFLIHSTLYFLFFWYFMWYNSIKTVEKCLIVYMSK